MSLHGLILALASPSVFANDCTVKLERAHSLIDGDGTVWAANYKIAECAGLVIDVSEYVHGGSALRGREPANFLEVTFMDTFSSMYLYKELEAGQTTITVSPAEAKLEEGSPILEIAAGQRVKIAVGIEAGERFERYFLSSVEIE